MDYKPETGTENVQKLCALLSPNDPDSAYELAIAYLTSTGDSNRSIQDEQILYQKVYAKLGNVSMKDADKFSECYQKLKGSFVLKQRAAVLSLLLALSESPQQTPNMVFQLPQMISTKSSIPNSTVSAASSKSAFESTSLKPQSSDQSLPSEACNKLMAIHSNDRMGMRQCVRAAVLAATGVRAAGAGAPGGTGGAGGVGGSRPVQALFARVAQLGVLHDRLKEFIDPASGLVPHGLMAEGLVSCVRDELTEYYRSVALLQSQVSEGGGGGASLRRACVWAQEPLQRLTWLANIAHAAQHKKGGELATCVHRFVRHGDERVAALARRLLTALTYPLLLMLTRWLLHGEIEDPYNEFFIESRSGVPIDRMWHDKYRLREWMVPSFMSRAQAAQVLATGKSVVFMRSACAGEPDAPPDQLQRLLRPAPDAEGGLAGASWWESAELPRAVAAAHDAAAARLLAGLAARHRLLDHLAAHRRYLLLAQGDFVHHLMTLLQDELNKPASALHVHSLTCTLEAAVRATNAQFEPPHVLERLHVNLYTNCDGADDSGWDVFALQYRVDGVLGTLFPAACAVRYRALFAQLWRVKRIEYALHHAWRQHALLSKRLKAMPEVSALLRRVSCLRAEALRLCGALQEAGGERAEPAWAELRAAAAAGRHLDELLALHRAALERHAVLAMIHATTQELQSYLGNVLNETLGLCSFEAALHAGVGAELDRRERLERLRGERVARGEYALTAADEAADKELRKVFNQFLVAKKADLNVWARTYRNHVTALILKLALHGEAALQTLAFRLDYSDYYKRNDAKLHQPLTYQHKRMSEINMTMAKIKSGEHLKKK